jgi:hypothetical protein
MRIRTSDASKAHTSQEDDDTTIMETLSFEELDAQTNNTHLQQHYISSH